MLFNSPEFAIFLSFVLIAFFLIPRRLIPVGLVLASYFFYAFFYPAYLLIFLFLTVFNYFYSNFARNSTHKRIAIAIVVLVNIGLLAYFKYADFLVTNINTLAHALSLPPPVQSLNVILPVGISFYVFQVTAYSIEVVLGRIPPAANLLELMLFKAWFPQLISGPIERPQHLIPQLRCIPEQRSTVWDRLPLAAALFAEGWVRKSAADLLALTADTFFNAPQGATSGEAVIGVIAFGLQIYGDFSGYTRMAQGVSWLFGVQLMENFNRPYLARDLRDFWQRWHISLSTWFRDYLYVPLGGNRKGRWRADLNIMLTMVVSGLWHGAGWNFVIWGAIHGTFVVAHHRSRRYWDRLPSAVAIPIVWIIVFLAWIPFRAGSLDIAGGAVSALFAGGWSAPPLSFLVAAAAIVVTDVVAVRQADRSDFVAVRRAQTQLVSAAWVTGCVLFGLMEYLLWHASSRAFIYFQF